MHSKSISQLLEDVQSLHDELAALSGGDGGLSAVRADANAQREALNATRAVLEEHAARSTEHAADVDAALAAHQQVSCCLNNVLLNSILALISRVPFTRGVQHAFHVGHVYKGAVHDIILN
jgi:hypothetical protein